MGERRAGTLPVARGLGSADQVHWPLVPSEKLFELRYGKALTEGHRRPGAIPVFGSNGQTGVHDTPLFEGPGVILGRKGMGHLGVEWTDRDFWVIDTAYSLGVLDNVDLKFAYYLIKHVSLDHLKHGTSNPSLTREAFAAQLFPVPPVDTQRAIAQVLGALDDKIAANDRIAALAKELLTTEFTRTQVDTDGGLTGRTTLTEIVELNPGLRAPAADEPAYLDMKNLPDHAMTATNWRYRAARGGARFQNGDTLLARITPCLENGKVGYVDFLEEGDVGIGSTEFIVMRPRGGIPTVFPYLLATSSRFRDFATKHMTGTSGRQRLAATDLAEYPLHRPDEDELARFESLSGDLMKRVKSAVNESRKLSTTRDSLLPLLMSGKARVRDAEKVVEEAV